MSTNSNIGILNQDGSLEVIYCHWDGYPDHNGKILLEHYQDENKIRQLMALGDLSSLGEEIGEECDFDNPTDLDQCISYFRDRGESNTMSQKYLKLEDFFPAKMQEYFYVWQDHKWLLYTPEGRVEDFNI